MFVTVDMIAAMVAEYGQPFTRAFEFEVTAEELARIRSSQKNGRNHDVTIYIRHGDKLILIAKHFYPPDLYRAPSGGLNPGESFEAGIAREVAEETGCRVQVERFLLRTSVNFKHDRQCLHWRSFVFMADYVEGDFQFTDHEEIRSVRVADWSEFDRFSEIMRATDIGGLHYRATLHETIVELLQQKSTPTGSTGDNA